MVRLFSILMKHFFALCFFVFSGFLWSQSIISGKVIDGEFNDVLPFANISLLLNDEIIDGTTTDFEGAYSFEVQPGTYSIEFSFVGYASQKITGINVKEGQDNEVSIVLQPASSELEEVVVTSSARNNTEASVLAIQKKSVTLIEGLSSQSMKKAGDNNLAAAIRRVPGVSVQGGKFVYVRGLGDRYSKTTLFGLDLPGLDPDKNTLQLDIFPTNLISNIIVNKSSSANLSADFTGGIVDIVLKDFSNLPEYSFSVGTSYNPGMNLSDAFITNESDSRDVFGFDNGYFDLPIDTSVDIPGPEVSDPLNSRTLTRITEQLQPRMGVTPATSFLDYNFGATASNQYKFSNGYSLGYIAAVGYRSDTDFYENYFTGTVNKEPAGVVENTSQRGKLGQVNTLLSGLLGLSFKTKTSKYTVNVLNIKSGESSAIEATFQDYLENPYIGLANILTYTERNILSIPVQGKHRFKEGKFKVDWKIAPSSAKVYDKDFKKTIFETNRNGDYYVISPATTQVPQRLWRTLDEDAISGKLDLTYSFEGSSVSGNLLTGLSYTRKERAFSTDNYSIDFIGRSEELGGDPNQLLAPGNIWTPETDRGSYVFGSYQRTNQYQAKSFNYAGYVSSELKLSEKWKSILGVRFENYRLRYTGETIEQTRFLDEKFIDVADFFPSANLIYALDEQTNLRASFSRTTARPSFKESSTAQIFDPITERYFIGNPELQPTYINNLDLRYEKFGENNQNLSFSLFYKNFSNPIEIVAFNFNSPNQLIGRNNESATVFGAEVELRKNLISNTQQRLALNLNASYIYSTQRMSDEEYEGRSLTERDRVIDRNRELQGQSPYLINAGVRYNLFDSNIESGLFYNVQGKTLEVVGVGNIPDVYTDPFHNLNFTLSKQFGKKNNQKVNLRVRNILGDTRESFYDYFGEVQMPFSLYEVGRTFSLSYSFKF